MQGFYIHFSIHVFVIIRTNFLVYLPVLGLIIFIFISFVGDDSIFLSPRMMLSLEILVKISIYLILKIPPQLIL